MTWPTDPAVIRALLDSPQAREQLKTKRWLPVESPDPKQPIPGSEKEGQ